MTQMKLNMQKEKVIH